ncbi:MAG: hypothetical protein ACYTF7_07290 [Planctomycetota bacterium]
MPKYSRTRAGTLILAALASIAMLASPAMAQDETTNQQLLEDFIHYVLIRNDALAEANANALLDNINSPVDFVALVEDSGRTRDRFDQAVRAAMVIPSTEQVAGQLFKLFEQGKLDRSRNPDEIAQNIQFLVDNPRARMLAQDRLKSAGEYAVPQLLQVLEARVSPALETEVQRLLVSMGSDAVMPLCAALLNVDDTTKERIALILGQLGSSNALPYLYDLHENTSAAAVRDAARNAIETLGAALNDGTSLDDRYFALAEAYYAESGSLTHFAGEDFQLLWSYDAGVGLYPTAIRTEIFHEARTREICEGVLAINESHDRAVALWVAANFSREIDANGVSDPTYPEDRRDATYYAVASGTATTTMVLARALEDNDTPLARMTLAAMRMTVGGANVTQLGPLLEALTYPDQRVQFQAALVLASARPTSTFDGSQRVVPLLASAVRNAEERRAVVIASDATDQQDLASILAGEGYTVLPTINTVGQLADVVADEPGVEMIVSSIGMQATRELIAEARSMPKLRATPIVATLPAEAQIELYFDPDRDPKTIVVRQGLTDEMMGEALAQHALATLGPAVRGDEAYRLAMESLSALRDLAIGEGSSLDPLDAQTTLIEAMYEVEEDDVLLEIAEVLSLLRDARSQVALMDAAMEAGGQIQIDLLNYVSASAKRIGNNLERRQIQDLADLALEGSDAEATAAAALLGALNLTDRDLSSLIVEG